MILIKIKLKIIYMDNVDTTLTHDEHKEVSADMLKETKDLT
jgi:hypothetical protein